MKNYIPGSLLSVFSKIFERLIYKAIFKHFLDNNLIPFNQSGFKPGHSCLNQLVAITHDIFKGFNDGSEIRGVFLDISKAFDKVWHEGLIYKLCRNGICGTLLKLLISFLDSRKQRVLLNGQCSSWGFINAGVPQGSILGPLLFLIYINNLTENLQSNPKLFADNTSLFTLINDPNATAKQVCEDLDKIKEWAFQWKMSFNPGPSKQVQEIIFTRQIKKVAHRPIFFNNKLVQQVSQQKHLGLILGIPLTFDEHIRAITSKVSKSIGLLRKLNNRLPRSSLITIYKFIPEASSRLW